MSRIEYTLKHERTNTTLLVSCGWDRPLQAFFVDILDANDLDGMPLVDVWPGFPKITEVSQLEDYLARNGFANALTNEATDYLRLDKQNNAGNVHRQLPDAVLA